MPEQIGSHYVLLRVDSRSGGLSTVRRAVDTRDGSSVAVKFVVGPTDELSRKVFEREVKTLSELSHPNIVRYREAGIDDTGSYYLILDWVDRNLADLLKDGPWESWDQLYRDFARPLLDGLAYAHLKQIEHRDIKPLNILISSAGDPLLADFGIAKIRGQQEDSELTVAGFRSGPYAPPEIDTPFPYVRDVYSVGVLLLQCLSAERIRDFPDIARALESVPVPPDARKLLEACVNPDPSERPRNASDLASALSTIRRERVARHEQGRNPVWLRLTNAAVEHLVGNRVDRARAASKLQADLAGELFASFRLDPETGEHNRSVVTLVGKEFRYTLKIDDDGSGCVVTAAAQPEFEALEGLRRRSCALPPIFTWTVQEPANRDLALRGLSTLVQLIDDFVEGKKEAGGEERPQEGNELFDTWLRILDAREDLARGEHEPIPYRSWRASGRQAVFRLMTPCELDLIGTEWQVQDPRSAHKFGWGEVIDQDGETLTLLGSRLKSLPESASLVPHIGPSEVSLARQRDAVTAVNAGTTLRPDLRQILLDPSTNAEPSRAIVDSWRLDLDESKREAVELALGAKDYVLVQGPPGTGKTSFIAETVAQFLSANPDAKVLIASQTHVAVDNALERLDRSGLQGLVRLAGVDESRVDASVQHLLLDAQTKRWTQGVRTRAEASVQKQAVELGIPVDHLRAALALQQLSSVCREIEAVEQSLRQGDDGTTSELTTALSADSLGSNYQDRIDSLSDYRAELVQDAQRHLAGDLTVNATISSGEAAAAVDVLLGGSVEVGKLLERLSLQAEWLQRIASDDSLAAVYLETTRVVAGTCTGFLRNRAVKLLDFDLCIVDEASKATLTEALVPISRARRWIIVGDTRQLPPTDEELMRATEIMREHEVTKGDVAQTLFQRLADLLPAHSQRMLRQQHRMIRPIGDLISTCFYDGQLYSPRSEGLDGYEKVFGRAVMWLDTGPLGDRRRESAPGGQATSYANRAEAQLVVKQLQTLDGAIDYRLVRPADGMERLEVLVISPYRSQVDELRRKLAPVAFKHLDPVVMSVDAVQGREADVAILSVTRSNPEGKLGFLGADYWRRINVALSRARYGLMIVGDAGFIQGTNGALRTVLDYISTHLDDCEVRLADRD
ncbi:protein kinase-like protein [Kribbella steppae]|uniref:Protein kinase-like protein n=1 Tax=Kribbella steppae TaxID=2512223 RepID=A0A4R2HQY9_9ACTN|nr:serine/threonine-protein kinase [Kribbella steppae]TCO33389.1 protein kinase-like protein [Kribbella steppae]